MGKSSKTGSGESSGRSHGKSKSEGHHDKSSSDETHAEIKHHDRNSKSSSSGSQGKSRSDSRHQGNQSESSSGSPSTKPRTKPNRQDTSRYHVQIEDASDEAEGSINKAKNKAYKSPPKEAGKKNLYKSNDEASEGSSKREIDEARNQREEIAKTKAQETDRRLKEARREIEMVTTEAKLKREATAKAAKKQFMEDMQKCREDCGHTCEHYATPHCLEHCDSICPIHRNKKACSNHCPKNCVHVCSHDYRKRELKELREKEREIQRLRSKGKAKKKDASESSDCSEAMEEKRQALKRLESLNLAELPFELPGHSHERYPLCHFLLMRFKDISKVPCTFPVAPAGPRPKELPSNYRRPAGNERIIYCSYHQDWMPIWDAWKNPFNLVGFKWKYEPEEEEEKIHDTERAGFEGFAASRTVCRSEERHPVWYCCGKHDAKAPHFDAKGRDYAHIWPIRDACAFQPPEKPEPLKCLKHAILHGEKVGNSEDEPEEPEDCKDCRKLEAENTPICCYHLGSMNKDPFPSSLGRNKIPIEDYAKNNWPAPCYIKDRWLDKRPPVNEESIRLEKAYIEEARVRAKNRTERQKHAAKLNQMHYSQRRSMCCGCTIM